MFSGLKGCFCFSRINNHYFMVLSAPFNAAPHNGMSYTGICPYKNQYIRFIYISERIRRSIKAKRLLIRNNGGCHTLSGISVTF